MPTKPPAALELLARALVVESASTVTLPVTLADPALGSLVFSVCDAM